MLEIKLLLLVLVANGAPVIATRLLGTCGAAPVDRSVRFVDGRPLFGPSKTLRGIIASIIATCLVAVLLGLSLGVGALIGVAAMAGDLFSSFIKRRVGIESSGMALGLDQIPESLFPLLAVRAAFDLQWLQIIGLTIAFMIAELLLSRALFALHIRQRPY